MCRENMRSRILRWTAHISPRCVELSGFLHSHHRAFGFRAEWQRLGQLERSQVSSSHAPSARCHKVPRTALPRSATPAVHSAAVQRAGVVRFYILCFWHSRRTALRGNVARSVPPHGRWIATRPFTLYTGRWICGMPLWLRMPVARCQSRPWNRAFRRNRRYACVHPHESIALLRAITTSRAFLTNASRRSYYDHLSGYDAGRMVSVPRSYS
jgi:hypothetical protein